MVGQGLSAEDFKKASDLYILEAVVRGDQFLIDGQFVPLRFLPVKDEKVVLRSKSLIKEIKAKFSKINEALSCNQRLIVNFNPRIYMNEEGDETDNDFCDQDPIDILTLVQLNSNENIPSEKLSTLEQRK